MIPTGSGCQVFNRDHGPHGLALQALAQSKRLILSHHRLNHNGSCSITVEEVVMLAVAVVGGTVGVGLKYFPMQCKIADVAFRQTYQILLKAELPSPKRSRSSRLKTLRP